MLDKINDFFKQLNTPYQKQNKKEQSIEMACTILLCEVMKADDLLKDDEKHFLKNFICTKFNLQDNDIIDTALTLSNDATDFYQFTKKINQHYSIEQRIEMVGYLWQLAYADGELAPLEEHIIRKISDLLHLRHSEYIQTKLANTPSFKADDVS